MIQSLRAPTRRTARSDDPLAGLERLHRRHCRGADLRLLREAYQVAARLHDGQTRDSGKPFITHPVAVARIVAELGLDTTTVAAALLHDTVEDTSYTLAHLRVQFGDRVAVLVDGVTKLDKIYFGEAAEAETFRKMILAARADVRVLIIKIADRLHNMRTIGHKSRSSQLRTATVTREIIIPLADRLGLYAIRRELEDLVLATTEPETYEQIDQFVRTADPDRAALVTAVRRRLGAALRRAHIRAEMLDRPRHHYSIYREMAKLPRCGPRNPPRLVLVVNDILDCYAALGVVHRTWRPIPGRFKDLIAAPKDNFYQSLHTTVLVPGDHPMDVLIRTGRMNQVAEVGIAADLTARDHAGAAAPQLEWLDRLLGWQQQAAEPSRFLESLRSDLAYHQITVTIGETTVSLPAGSTCVDVAYQLDSVVAGRLVAATVNGRPAPLTAPLSDGDRVELIHAAPGDPAGPSRDWLRAARTPVAQLQIGTFFADHEPRSLAEKVRSGRIALARALRQRDRALPNDQTLAELATERGYPDQDALLMAIHLENLDPDQLADALIAHVDRHTMATGRWPATPVT
jgi:guanosine-3',5'-bis(diphosphate) 3'-pyrophosphohydrolase